MPPFKLKTLNQPANKPSNNDCLLSALLPYRCFTY